MLHQMWPHANWLIIPLCASIFVFLEDVKGNLIIYLVSTSCKNLRVHLWDKEFGDREENYLIFSCSSLFHCCSMWYTCGDRKNMNCSSMCSMWGVEMHDSSFHETKIRWARNSLVRQSDPKLVPLPLNLWQAPHQIFLLHLLFDPNTN